MVLMMMALVGALSMQAEEYTYLTFETTDGGKGLRCRIVVDADNQREDDDCRLTDVRPFEPLENVFLEYRRDNWYRGDHRRNAR